MNLRIENQKTSMGTQWVEKYYDRIYPVILRMVANEDIAKDLTQDTFLRAWEKRDTFRGDSDPGTWLHRIAVNLTLTYISKNKRYATCEIEEFAVCEKSDNAVRKVEKLSEGEIVRRAVSRLPENYRITLILHYFEDMRLEEIAKVTNISKGTAAWRLFMARKMILKNLRKDGIEL